MSEDEKSYDTVPDRIEMETWKTKVFKLDERISELEKRYDSQVELWSQQGLDFEQKIAELREKVEIFEMHNKYGTVEQILNNIEEMKKTWDQNIEDVIKQTMEALDKRDEEIAELRASSASHTEKIATLDLDKKLKIDYMMKMNQLEKNDKAHQACHDKAFKEIKELKERYDKSYSTNSLYHYYKGEFNNLKEVLRELISTFTGEFPIVELMDIGDKLLAKLDGGSARQTEEKPVLVFDDRCKAFREASGGVDKSKDSTHILIQCPKCNHKYLIKKEDINEEYE